MLGHLQTIGDKSLTSQMKTDVVDYTGLIASLAKTSFLAKWSLRSDFYGDTILNRTWMDGDNIFWGAGRRRYLGPKSTEMAEMAVEIAMGEQSPKSIYTAPSPPQSTFDTPSATSSSLPDSDYFPSIFSRSSSRTSLSSMSSEKEMEVRELWELGRIKEERQKLLDPLQQRVAASKTDETVTQDEALPTDTPTLDDDDDVPEVAVRAAHIPRYSQKFKELKAILPAEFVPWPIDMAKINAAMEESKKYGIRYEIVVDDEEEEELGQLMYPDEGDELINVAELDWVEEADITSTAVGLGSGDQAVYGDYDMIPEDVYSGPALGGVQEPAYSQVTSLDYPY
ncbi:hypothetical protein QCA50_004754 [Cerrena zonata]|uniref:Uncharacterized protein n=1 Tax=Cerrena zonata TaxID=2478898 RepID=A0AAW0GFH3_9APHY